MKRFVTCLSAIFVMLIAMEAMGTGTATQSQKSGKTESSHGFSQMKRKNKVPPRRRRKHRKKQKLILDDRAFYDAKNEWCGHSRLVRVTV